MNDTAPQPDHAADPPGPGAPASLLLPIDPAEFHRQVAWGVGYQRIALGLTVAAIAVVLMLPLLLPDQDAQRLPALLAVLVVPAVWVPLSMTTTRVARALPMIGAALAGRPAEAERMIREQLARKPVMRWARLLVYHRLATLRHHQRRFDESATICQLVLQQPLAGPAASARPHLLLMLAEAQLCRDDLPGAYRALDALHRTRLSLADAIQRLALQTRYALKAGDYDHALAHGRRKVELAELMPAPQCGAVHAMLATAAHKAGRPELATWLWERAELLCPPQLMLELRRGAFEVEVVVPQDGDA